MASRPASKTLADFRAAHDPGVYIPKRIQAALDAMRAQHPETWLYEADFLKLAGVANNSIGLYREQFEAHIVETRGRSVKRVWFADAKVATKARGE